MSDYQDAVNWQPERPCREEIRAIVAFIRDQLTAEGLIFVAEQDDIENPNCWVFVCQDGDGYHNLGFLSWNSEAGGVVFAGLKPEVVRRDELEDVPEDESRCFWHPSDVQMFVQLLNGDVRRIVAEMTSRQIRAAEGEQPAAA